MAPGVLHWRVRDERIGGATAASHAVRAPDGSWVLVDPLPLAEEALAGLEPASAVVLTAATHQRSAWRYRRQLGARVYLPEGSRATDEEPDERYRDGDVLPGGLRAIRTPGPEAPHYSLLLGRDGGVLFSPDLVMRYPEADGSLAFVPPELHEDPAETRRSVERMLQLDFGVLCLAHGAPITADPRRALRKLLAATA